MNNAQQIASELKKRLESFESDTDAVEYGKVVELKDGIARISGLRGCMSQELLEFENGIKALALNLEEEAIGAVILGDYTKISEGDKLIRTGKVVSVPVGEDMIGRVINPLGEAIDGKGAIVSKKQQPIERKAPGVIDRAAVNEPLATGIQAVDALIPIGKGQRELIIGDRQTGKTAIAIDTILNQKGKDVICIYVSIGQKESKLAKFVNILDQNGAMEYTTVISAPASDPAPVLYLAPYSGIALAEYFCDQGKDVLIVYDDLTKHAWAYRELSLLLSRPPGREAYPGDVFYIHSRLLERAVKLSEENGGGSITALPIIETQAADISAYIPTNVISITDGQIFLESDLFNRGMRPAVNPGLSVSRVGSAAQTKCMKAVAGRLKLDLAQFRELEAFSQFASDLDEKTKSQIYRGQRIMEILKQKQYMPMKVSVQVASIFAVTNGYFDQITLEEITKTEGQLHEYFEAVKPEILKELDTGIWSDEIAERLHEACKDFLERRVSI